MINRKLQEHLSERTDALGSKKAECADRMADDYEMLENIDFLRHIDFSDHNSLYHLTQDFDSEEEIQVKVDFLEDLTYFDELDYFDELNKTLEKEILALDKEKTEKSPPLIRNRFHQYRDRLAKYKTKRYVWRTSRAWRIAGISTGAVMIVTGLSLAMYFGTRPSREVLSTNTEESILSEGKPLNEGGIGNGLNLQPVGTVSPGQVEATTAPTVAPTATAEEKEIANSKETKKRKLQEVVQDPSFFNDVVFVGNSLTVGLQQCSQLSNTTFLAAKSLNVVSAYTKEVTKDKSTKQQLTILEALEQRKYSKIYIMFGINELGWPSAESFANRYAEFVAEIKKIQPNAEIYIQSILPVTEKKAAGNKIYNNENIERFNKVLEKKAKEIQVIYLDVASSLKNERGALPDEASADGVHLKKEYYQKWLAYIEYNS